MLRRMGVETTYYDPRVGAEIASLFRPNTKAVFVESPGSQSLEVQDIPAIAEVAHARGACVVADNTWATPLFFPPTPGASIWRSRPAPISLRPFRSAARPGVGQRRLARTAQARRAPAGDSGRPRGRLSRAARLAHHGAEAARSGAPGARPRRMARRASEVQRVIHPAGRTIPTMGCGSAISPGRRDCSASC